MHRPRTAHRWRLLATIMVGIFVACGSFWLLQVMLRSDPDLAVNAAKGEPDYIVDKFSFVRMTAQGQPHYLFYGAKLTHHPDDDTSEVELPMVKNMTPGAAPMNISAQRGRIRHAEGQVDLLGKVDVLRPALGSVKSLHITTEALTVFPDEDRMQSDQKVVVMLGSTTVTGTGMRANNATRQLDFASRGQIVFPPKAAR